MSYDQSEIEALVRQIVTRTLGNSTVTAASNDGFERRTIIDEEAVRQMPTGSLQKISEKTLVTPLAHQVALERRIRFVLGIDPVHGRRIALSIDWPSCS